MVAADMGIIPYAFFDPILLPRVGHREAETTEDDRITGVGVGDVPANHDAALAISSTATAFVRAHDTKG